MSESNKRMDRRRFLRSGLRAVAGVGIAGAVGGVVAKGNAENLVWQIDPDRCIACGICATACVLTPSAVKVVHEIPVCGFCDLCFGYFAEQRPGDTETAENLRCPTDAIIRNFVEEPYYEYLIDEPKCIGCAICVEGCRQYGNGSLILQVRHDRCVDCNECAIAVHCPADAFVRVPASDPYLLRRLEEEDEEAQQEVEVRRSEPQQPQFEQDSLPEEQFEEDYDPGPLEIPDEDHGFVEPEMPEETYDDQEDADDLLDLLGVDMI